MAFKTIQFEIKDQIATLTLNRPDCLNALNYLMHEEIQAAINLIRSDTGKARCLVITGAGRGFCAGADLAETLDPANPTDLGNLLETWYNPLIKKIMYLPMPVVAAVNGTAAGAGMSIALAADIVLAARSASFLQAFVNIGLIPDAGSTYLLPRLVGKARAYRLAMLGEKLSAEKAVEWGLISECVDDELLMSETMKTARKFATGPTQALASIRRALAESERNSLSEQLDLERDLQQAAGYSSDFYEGVAAFMEKRAAKFSGC